MKTRTKVIIAILVGLFGLTLLISGSYKVKIAPEEVKEHIQPSVIKIEEQNKEETTNTNRNIPKKQKSAKNGVKTANKKTTKNTNQSTGGYLLTHYGYDCSACSGTTAKGYDISKTQYYNDSTYGKVRVVAMCSKYPFYTIIKIKNYKMGGDILAIVLDRGVGCGTIDLAVENEKTASNYGIQKNVQIEILRRGN